MIGVMRVSDESGHERAECGADHDADRKVDNVAAQPELLEVLEHAHPPRLDSLKGLHSTDADTVLCELRV